MGRRRPALPRLPLRARRHQPRPRPPGGRRGAGRAGPRPSSTCRTCSAPSPARRSPARSTGCSAAAVRCSSPTRAPRPTSAPSSWPASAAGGAATSWSARSGSFHGRTLATLHATGQPAKHEAFQPLPEGFRHVAWNDLDALGGGARPVRRRRAARAGAGRGRREPGDRRVLRRRAAAVRRAGHPVHGRRGADRPRSHRSVVRPPALRRRARRRHDGQGARQRRADRRLLGPGRGRRRLRARRPRHHLRRPAARHRGGPGRARRRWRPRTCPPGRPRPASGSTDAPARARHGVAERARPRPARSPPSWPTARRPGGRRRRARPPGSSSTRSPRRPCGWRRRCWSPTTRSTRPSPILGAAVPGRPPHDPSPARDRRPDAGELADGARPRARPGAPAACSTGGASPCSSRSRRPAPATRPRWRSCSSAGTRSTSGPTRSASTSGRRPRTWPAPWPATTPSSAPGCSSTPTLERMAAVSSVPVVNLLSDDEPPAPGRRRPAHDPGRVRPARRASRSPGSATSATWPGRSAWPPALSGMGVRFACPPGYGPTDVDLDRLAATGAAEVHRRRRAAKAVDGRRRRRRPTPGTSMGQEDEAERAATTPSRASPSTSALLDRRAPTRHLPALPAGPPGRGGRRRR